MRQRARTFAVAALLLGAAGVAAAGGHGPAASGAPQASALFCSGVDVADLKRPHVFRYGLTGPDLQSQFFDKSGLKSQGFRPRRLTGYRAGSSQLFATKWVQAPGPEWNGQFGLTGDGFGALYSQLRSTHRPIDVSGYNTPSGAVRFAAIWERNTPRVDWRLHRDVSRAGMDGLVDKYADSGFVPLRVEGYASGGQLRYVSIWVKTKCTWRMHNRMTGAEYQAKFDEYSKTRRLVHLDAFVDGGTVYYAGIWWKQPGPGQDVRSDRDWYLFQRTFNNNACIGRVLDNFYATDVPGAIRYGGIWTSLGAPTFGASSSLASRVAQEVNCAPGRAGAAVVNLTTGEQVLAHADATYGASSTIKSAILFSLLKKIDATDDTLDTTIPAGPTQYGTNQGSTLSARRSYPLRTFAQTMIDNSNNWATNRLIDYLGGFRRINGDIASLGSGLGEDLQLRRYFVGTGAPSAHGNDDPGDDYYDGYDNTVTPRAFAAFLRLMHENAGKLSRTSFTFFWSTLGLNGDHHDKILDAGVSTSRSGIVTLFAKDGSNGWSSVPKGKPQLAARHRQRSAVGRLVFANGQVAVYAVFVDEGTTRTTTPLQNVLDCVVMHAVRQYSGTTTGADVPACRAG